VTDIEKVRVIIQDTPLYAKEEISMDGVQKSVQMVYFPLISSTVTVTGTAAHPPDSVGEDNGDLHWNTALAIGVYTFEYNHVNLLDSAIQAFLDLESGEAQPVKLAAADALDAIASSQALIQKKLKVLDLETDGPALAKALRDHAISLRKQVFSQDFDEPTFDIAEQINDGPGFSEKVLKDFLRGM
jgi:hypothetical protein